MKGLLFSWWKGLGSRKYRSSLFCNKWLGEQRSQPSGHVKSGQKVDIFNI